MLTTKQIHKLSTVIAAQTAFFIGNSLGKEYLSNEDKIILKKNGIDPEKVYIKDADLVTNNYVLGMLAVTLGDKEVRKLSFEQLVTYVGAGKHLELTSEEKSVVRGIKTQSLSDIRVHQGNILRDITNIANENMIKDIIVAGKKARKTEKQIVWELRLKTGDWIRDFQKHVQYISHTALNEGKAAVILRKQGSLDNSYVYFNVKPGACPKCIELYLTAGAGSLPIIFSLQQLRTNGTNIGKRVKEYKPTLSALHVNCRCTVTEYLGKVKQRRRGVKA